MSSYVILSPAHYFSSIWRPRIRDLFVFAALSVLGFLVWEINPSTTLTNALGITLEAELEGPLRFFLLRLVEPALRCLVALLAGFLFPRGFYLWGMAIAIHTPLSTALTHRAAAQEGITIVQGGVGELLGYAAVVVMFSTVAVFAYTTFAGVGVLVRYPFERRRAARRSRP